MSREIANADMMMAEPVPDARLLPISDDPSRPQAGLLRDGRLHLHHGPIDLIIGAKGPAAEVRQAYMQAYDGFDGVLNALADEYPALRSPANHRPTVCGPVATRMVSAVLPYADEVFVTPMAAVAGAVADEILAAMIAGRRLDRAFVNDGGDIALHLATGESLTVGLVPHLRDALLLDSLRLSADYPCRGLATSGWDGRSLSLGIADAVTVLAATAAEADAAATLIANDVDTDHPEIRRTPARMVVDDSDLEDLLVTTGVGTLPPNAVDDALDAGAETALRYVSEGRILGAFLVIGTQMRAVGGVERLLASASSARSPKET